MDKAIKSGKDPHGNALSPKSLDQLRFLATGLRTQISMTGAKAKAETKADAKIAKVMGEFKHGTLNTGSPKGPKVRSRAQALAIALSQAARASHSRAKKKEIAAQVETREQDARPFTAFKDASGRYRWIIRSSSSYEDRDGETISQKALEQAVERLNASGNFGDLDWWHTPHKIGTCDFSAMHGRVLIESGTFVNERIGEKVATAIANKSFKPGASLMFSHSEPGPPVLPGRVFKEIEIIRRALLDEEKASNAATGMEIINYSNLAAGIGGLTNTKEVSKKMDEKKEQRLRELLGPEVFDAFINNSETAEKALQVAGYSYKAMAPEPVAPVVVAGPAPDVDASGPVTVVEAAPVEVAAEVAAAPAETTEGAEGEEGEAVEFDTEAIFSDLVSRIKTEIIAALPTAIREMQAAQPVASKEVTDALAAQTTGLKQVTNTLTGLVAENKSLKERLDALEGNQPAGVRARVTQGQGLSAAELNPAHQDLVNPAQKEVDPYAKIIADLGLTMAPRG